MFPAAGNSYCIFAIKKSRIYKRSRKTESDKVIHIEGVGHKLNYALNGGVVEVEGGDNTLTVKGSAKKLQFQEQVIKYTSIKWIKFPWKVAAIWSTTGLPEQNQESLMFL